MKAGKITDSIYWVGGIDWDLRNFHGYLTQRGSTYNAYVIIDEKITLIDSVKVNLYDEFIQRISNIIDPGSIDYIVSNHVELDHSGSLPKLLELAPQATIITSPRGKEGLQQHFPGSYSYQVVRSGDVVNIGQRNLHFVQTPMVHWPDNMMTYIPEDKILFSNDAFGQHLASAERIDSEIHLDIVLEEARKYYANIVLPYSGQVRKALETASQLDIKIIAPSHGIIWERHIDEIIAEYTKWSANITLKKAIIVYDSMWQSTEKMAYAIEDAFAEKGYKTAMYNLQHNHISDIMTTLILAKYICVGSPTLNRNLLPTVAAFLTYLKGLAPPSRNAVAFGSYGWGGKSVDQIAEYLRASKCNVLKTFEIKYIPSEEQLVKIKTEIKELIK